MKKYNKQLKYLLFFLGYIALFYVLCKASVNMVLFPFAFGMLFALTWANQKVYLVAVAYLISSLLSEFTLECAICSLVTIFVLILPYFIHVLCKKNMRKWEFGLFAVISQVGTVTIQVLNSFSPVLSVVNVVLGVLYMYLAIVIFEAFFIRKLTNKLTSLELVSLFVLMLSVCAGLVNLNIGNFSFLKLFVSLIIFVFAYTSTPLLTMLSSVTAGIGALIATNNPIYVAPFVFWALCALLFKNRYKIFMIISVICVEVVIGLYFNLYVTFDFVEILPVLISCLIFFALPNKLLGEVAVIFNLSKDRMAMKNVVNRNRELLHKRMANLAEVFNDMNVIYRNMLKKNMSTEDVKKILVEELRDKICSYCPERNHCHRTFAENTQKVFDELITVAFERGKVTLLDIPSYLTSRCKQTSAILGSINALTSQYKKYLSMQKDVDTSKVIIADQLLGVSKVLSSLSKELDTNISFDTMRENKILDELTYHNIVCIDAVVYERDVHTEVASLVVRNEDSKKLRIVDCVGKVCGQKMAVYETFASARPNYTVVNLKTAPRYDCIFGVAQKTKVASSASGDTYTIIKLDGERVLFAVSDGMGSGEEAQNISELSISLIENFYKAGFDNEIILSTVNKLLALHKEDIFSAIDVGVLDLKNGIIDFIKMASPNTFIVSEDGIKEISASCLPMGIVEDVSLVTNKQVASGGDFIVLVTDGVSDCFYGEEFVDELKTIKTKNPQEFADLLLEKALNQNGGVAKDDMSVLVIKIFENA